MKGYSQMGFLNTVKHFLGFESEDDYYDDDYYDEEETEDEENARVKFAALCSEKDFLKGSAYQSDIIFKNKDNETF